MSNSRFALLTAILALTISTALAQAQDALFVHSNGNVGVGTNTPGAPLTVSSPETYSYFRIEALDAPVNTSADMTFTAGPNSNGEYRINVVDGDGPEMRVDAEGFVIAATGFKVGDTSLVVPDYVFEPNYVLRPLAEVADFVETNQHLPEVPSAADVARDGLDMTGMQMTLLKKVEELTLYTLAQEEMITELRSTLADERARTDATLAALQDRMSQLEIR
ncbi:hypothetical protein [Gilvimarinus sp. 1_MG-2023]|uniref:hypothetical protein n=1 Tax=Gilvimarinus sp. 1_MG-2023 TaxID=3062638 RepID=UPI0026E1570F|nr:hypothetical protein [Gilvimarinus sp. 1_MG-2023]MDO6746270.1 hypothetical protein [Gilvimarinus sp. 1_MG-2023]